MAREVILFAGALYDDPLWTNRQHIASRLAERGWRVLYVEPRLFAPRMLLGAFRGTRGRFPWARRLLAPWRVMANLAVLAQANVLPWSREVSWVSRLNHALNVGVVRTWAFLLGFQRPVLFLYDTEAAQFLSAFLDSRVVYDCVDDHRAQAGVGDRNPRRVEEEERAIVARADAIAVTTPSLHERFSRLHGSVHLVPNAADVGSFAQASRAPGTEPKDLASIPHPRLGVVGALESYKMDVPLLADVARRKPHWHVVLIGPVETIKRRGKGTVNGEQGVETLRRFPNVHFLGVKPREAVPSYVQAFDVAMIPYRESPYNRSSFPVKFWEVMASGRPVVATGLPSLAPYGHLAELPKNASEFMVAVERALSLDTPEKRVLRQQEAERHDWRVRVTALEALLLGEEK